MKNPKLIVKPFAKNGQKNVIPENYETSMDSNQATWDQGFGQITMLPVAAGGLPPKGQDFNGILNQISENIVYQSQGGRFKFSPEYAESIGGYPKGAILQSDDEKKDYQSLIDNNKVNFNTESNISTSWELVGAKYAIKNEVDLALLKKFDKENISGALGNDNHKVPSLNLLTTEVGKLQPKGNYQPAGDYATNTALTSGLAGKQPVGDYATNTALENGLVQKLNTSSVVQSTGSSTTQVMSQDATTKTLSMYATKESLDVVAVPIGGSILWNTTAPIPSNFWANEGRYFSETEYPEASKIFPDLRLPDDRGYAIRIADNGRGIDTGREVGTYQEDAMQKIYGRIAVAGSKEVNNPTSYADGAFYIEGDNFVKNGAQETGGLKTPTFNFDSGRVTRTAAETRMKNVAKILITRMK